MKNPKSWAVFLIKGENLDPKRISSVLHLEPSFSLPSSQNSQNGKGIWQLNSHLPETDSVENHLWTLLKKLAPVRKQVQEFLKEFEICFYCSIDYTSEDESPLRLGARLLSLIGNLGVELEIQQWDEKNKNLSANGN